MTIRCRLAALLARMALLLLVPFFATCSRGSVPRKYSQLPAALQGPFIESIPLVYPGTLDVTNRFLPAVGINTPAKLRDGEGPCSGVLITPRLVLTAGHCVCLKQPVADPSRARLKASVENAIASLPRKVKDAVVKDVLAAAEAVIDRTDCAPVATVTVHTYPPEAAVEPGKKMVTYSITQLMGTSIRPHDELMIAYQGRKTIFKESDLAIIVLEERVPNIPRLKLADTAVKRGDPVLMAGFGYGSTERAEATYGNRNYAQSVTVRVAGSDSRDVKFDTREEPQDGGIPAGLYGGDSGGPCFSKDDDSVLVGIATAITSEDAREKRSVFTSVYSHREWIKKVAREVGEPLP